MLVDSLYTEEKTDVLISANVFTLEKGSETSWQGTTSEDDARKHATNVVVQWVFQERQKEFAIRQRV